MTLRECLHVFWNVENRFWNLKLWLHPALWPLKIWIYSTYILKDRLQSLPKALLIRIKMLSDSNSIYTTVRHTNSSNTQIFESLFFNNNLALIQRKKIHSRFSERSTIISITSPNEVNEIFVKAIYNWNIFRMSRGLREIHRTSA